MRSMKMEAGYTDKQAARILTVDQKQRRVECALRDGGIIYAAVWETPFLFRWPKTGEVWTIRRDAGVWRLDGLLDNPNMEGTAIPLADLGEGQARILAEPSSEGSGLYINTFHATRKIAFAVGDGIATIFPVKHNFGAIDIAYSILEVSTGIYVDADVTKSDENTMQFKFGLAPTTDQFRVTIIG